MFKITSPNGFHITFPNGITLSTQFGSMHYCDNNNFLNPTLDIDQFPVTCENCEVAVWNQEENWITKEIVKKALDKEIDDDVIGYIHVPDWIKILNCCYNYYTNQEEREKIMNPKTEELRTLMNLLNKFNFINNHMSIKDLKEKITEELWIDKFKIKFKTFNVVDGDKLIGKITCASMIKNEEDRDAQDSPTYIKSYLKLAFAYCDLSREKFSKLEGEKFALHRLLCDEPNIIANAKYTKVDHNFIKKNPDLVLPFQAYVRTDNVNREEITEQIKKEIIKCSNSMGIIWMLGITTENIK